MVLVFDPATAAIKDIKKISILNLFQYDYLKAENGLFLKKSWKEVRKNGF